MSIRIITDSASDMSEKESRYLKVLPLTVEFGETEYLDGVTLTAEEFYKKLETCDDLPKTSQVTPFDFEEAIREALEAGETPIVITISSKLSGTAKVLRSSAPWQPAIVNSMISSKMKESTFFILWYLLLPRRP